MNHIIKKTNGLIWLSLTLVVVIVDIASKFLVHYSFYLHESIKIFPFFSITYARNTGAAFSLFEGQRWFLAIIALIISGVIIYMVYKNGRDKKLENFSLALILGGALGNLFDRLYHGFVIDFFDINFGTWRYPTFNLADCAICVGIAIFILSNYLTKRDKNENNSC